jgi:hypothetical protein
MGRMKFASFTFPEDRTDFINLFRFPAFGEIVAGDFETTFRDLICFFIAWETLMVPGIGGKTLWENWKNMVPGNVLIFNSLGNSLHRNPCF